MNFSGGPTAAHQSVDNRFWPRVEELLDDCFPVAIIFLRQFVEEIHVRNGMSTSSEYQQISNMQVALRLLSEKLSPVLCVDLIASHECFINILERLDNMLIAFSHLFGARPQAKSRSQQLVIGQSSWYSSCEGALNSHVEGGCEESVGGRATERP